MGESSTDETAALDRVADAVVPSFRRRPSMPPSLNPKAPEFAAASEVVIPPAAAVPNFASADAGLAPEVAPPAAVAPVAAIAELVAPVAAIAELVAPRLARPDATPLAIPRVVLPEAGVLPGGDVKALTTTVAPPSQSAKVKKKLRSVPEPSVKSETTLSTPASRVAVKNDGPSIVFNDSRAPSRQRTVPSMASVTLPGHVGHLGHAGNAANAPTLRPPKGRPPAKAPVIPALIAAVTLLAMAAVILKARGTFDAPPGVEKASTVVRPRETPPPVVEEEATRDVPPPPSDEDLVTEGVAGTAGQAAEPIAPDSGALAARTAAPARPAAPAWPPSPAAAKSALPAPSAQPAPVLAPPAPVAPAAPAVAPSDPVVPRDVPTPAPKAHTPPKAVNSSAAPPIVRDNPF